MFCSNGFFLHYLVRGTMPIDTPADTIKKDVLNYQIGFKQWDILTAMTYSKCSLYRDKNFFFRYEEQYCSSVPRGNSRNCLQWFVRIRVIIFVYWITVQICQARIQERLKNYTVQWHKKCAFWNSVHPCKSGYLRDKRNGTRTLDRSRDDQGQVFCPDIWIFF